MTESTRESLLSIITRRQFVAGGMAAAGVFMIPKFANASLSNMHRTLKLQSIHTGEKVSATYWEKGRYVPEALAEINRVLRDHRTNDVHPMDKNLLDLLVDLHHRLGSGAKFEVISGYRSPRSNAMLHDRSNGVAKKSMHMEGKAIDIVLADRSLSSVRDAAIQMGRGGVGFYSGSFVHVDTGRVRKW
jgi:uncharacterized protein YcbK (DUF882 family)